MLFEFRDGVARFLTDKLSVAVWDALPDDVAEVPCVVVARPSARETGTAVVFDLSLDVVVIGRRQEAGGSEAELVVLADDVWTVLGGTRGIRVEGTSIAVTGVEPRVISVAGLEHSAYVIAVETSTTTC